VIPSIEEHRSELAELCRRHHVLRLSLFGSATRDDFDPQQGDLDFDPQSRDQCAVGRHAGVKALGYDD